MLSEEGLGGSSDFLRIDSFLLWAFPGLFWGLIFPFSWYIVRLQLTNFTMVNYVWKLERSRKSMHQSITRHKKKPVRID